MPPRWGYGKCPNVDQNYYNYISFDSALVSGTTTCNGQSVTLTFASYFFDTSTDATKLQLNWGWGSESTQPFGVYQSTATDSAAVP
jgi:hypothetical protein